MRETRIRQCIAAPPAVVYRLLLDPAAIAAWKVPDGMACQVHRFDARMQGWMTACYRLRATAAGTQLLAIHSDLPAGVSLADNETGWATALHKLAALAATAHATRHNA